jgi:death-on-curing protein
VARLRYLDRPHVEFIAHRLAARLFTDYSDPLPAFQLFGGLRDGGALLESALGLPRQHYYRGLTAKAAVMLRSLIKNHPLVDGNKRVAMASTLVFLAMNHRFLIASNDEMVNFALDIATRKPDMSWKEIARWIEARIFPVGASSAEVKAFIRSRSGDWTNPLFVAARLDDYVVALEDLRQEYVRDASDPA